jgi:hypothetical protein
LGKQASDRVALALYEIQSIRSETMRGECLSFQRLIFRDLTAEPQRAGFAGRDALKGTSFAQPRMMIVIAYQTGHQWRLE